MAKRLYSYTDNISISLKLQIQKIEITNEKSTFYSVKLYRAENCSKTYFNLISTS